MGGAGQQPVASLRQGVPTPVVPTDPAQLEGEALDRWYRRSPIEVERERFTAAQQRYDDYFGGSLAAASPEDLTEFRAERAAFGGVRRDIAKQNRWMAIPALAPVAAVFGLEASAALAARAVTRPMPRGPTSLPGPVAANKADTPGRALRKAARVRFERANGVSAKKMDAEVHHSDPIEYAHLKPNADPNRLANLWGLRDEAHQMASNGWTALRSELKGRAPTQAEIMATKLKIDRAVAPYVQRRGVSRPGPRPPSGRKP
jgi:hypothetical protein